MFPHKTLPHALARAAATGLSHHFTISLPNVNTNDHLLGAAMVGNDRLGVALADYASGQEKVDGYSFWRLNRR